VIDIYCLGCKRSRVQISAARPYFLKDLQTADFPKPAVWSLTGVQKIDVGRSVARRSSSLGLANFHFSNPPGLSLSLETRQTRQMAFKSLMTKAECLSGRPQNPTKTPTNHVPKPDKSNRREIGSEISQSVHLKDRRLDYPLKQIGDALELLRWHPSGDKLGFSVGRSKDGNGVW
jgi:hypothetical protein